MITAVLMVVLILLLLVVPKIETAAEETPSLSVDRYGPPPLVRSVPARAAPNEFQEEHQLPR